MNRAVLPAGLTSLLPQDLHELCLGSHYNKRDFLFRAGKPPLWMFYVVSGEFTLERTGLQGESIVLQRTRTGFVSEASLKMAKYHCDAIAVNDAVVFKVPIAQLADALARDPAFAGRWIDMLSSEVRRLRLHCERLSMKAVKDRLVHLIQTEGVGARYAVPSGLKTLAGELGVTHEALYRTIAKLQESGHLSKTDGFLTLRRSQGKG